jgi:3-oxoacyl-[acyl-carrier-protein] synthase-1
MTDAPTFKDTPVFIAGAGVISAIGLGKANCLEALTGGRAGIGDMHRLDSIYKGQLPVAEVPYDNGELAAIAGLSPGVSRTALLSVIAAREALEDANLTGAGGSGIAGSGIAGHKAGKWRTGFISANSVGGMDKTEAFYPAFLSDPKRGRLRDVVNHECGAVTDIVADRLGIRHFTSTISTACSSSANAILFGSRMIRHNLLDVVIAGGTDALTKFTLNGFHTLMILDASACRPFDENRRGLNLGEGAGYVVLVSERVAGHLRTPYARLSGYANACDAFHQTASSPDGTGSLLAMRGALAKSGLAPKDISYINLHGTGTQNNDIAEGKAIQTLFAPHYPPMSSTKSFTGHTLGACGGIEAVFSVLSIAGGIIYPNLRLETPMKDLPFVPETTLRQNEDIRHVLSNSFGFGGNCTSLVFSKP